MSRIRVAVLLAGATLAAAGARAQTPLTLSDAVAAALAAHPLVKSAENRRSAADAEMHDTRHALMPRLTVEGDWQRTNQPVLAFGFLLSQRRFTAADFAVDSLNHPAATTDHRIALSVEQLVFDGGQTSASVRGAGARADAAAADTARARADLILTVSQTFVRLMRATADVRSAQAARDAADADLTLVTNRRDAGLETDAAHLAQQAAADRADADLVTAVAEEHIARAALNSLLDRPVDAEVTLAAPEPDIAGADAGVTALTAAALTNRPELQRASSAVRAAEAALTQARRTVQFPSLVAIGTVEGNGATFGDRAGSWTAGLVARWSVSGAGEGAKLAAASATLEAARSDMAAEEKAIRLDVASAVEHARGAAARERASRHMVDSVREAQRITRNRYQAGLASAADLARSASDVAAAEALRNAAVADLIAAGAELDHAVGKGARR